MLRNAILAALCAIASLAASAQERTARLVVPVPPGGNFDLVARPLAARLSAATGDNWIVEHRPGAENMIGAEFVARSPADGRTALVAGVTVTLTPLMRKTTLAAEDLRPIAGIVQAGYVLVVSPQSTITSASDLAAAAAGSAKGLNCAAGPGPLGLGCVQLVNRLGGKVQSIPFQGTAQALTALMGGHVDLFFAPSDVVMKLVETGKVRAIATSPAMPALKVPQFTDLWPGFVMENHAGLFVPASTPEVEVRRLNAVVNSMLADPVFIAAMRDAGQEPLGGTPEQFAQRVERARARYAELLPRLENPAR
jgi:tripartite-type tricarboxylate transporter receptor subunit TctC